MKVTGEKLFLFLIGAFMYSLIEIAARGFTHWTMFITGGICLMVLYDIDRILWKLPLGIRCIAGALFITFTEFTVGIAVNVKFGWNVWDYSGQPLNLMGQICFPYSICWFFLCFAAYGICHIVRKRFQKFPV
jgi:uncharacterized membrane protein